MVAEPECVAKRVAASGELHNFVIDISRAKLWRGNGGLDLAGRAVVGVHQETLGCRYYRGCNTNRYYSGRKSRMGQPSNGPVPSIWVLYIGTPITEKSGIICSLCIIRSTQIIECKALDHPCCTNIVQSPIVCVEISDSLFRIGGWYVITFAFILCVFLLFRQVGEFVYDQLCTSQVVLRDLQPFPKKRSQLFLIFLPK